MCVKSRFWLRHKLYGFNYGAPAAAQVFNCMNTMATNVSEYRKTRAQTGSSGTIVPKSASGSGTIARAYDLNQYTFYL